VVDIEGGGVLAQTVIVDGVPVQYHVAGTTTGTRTPIVLVHGLGGSTQAHMSYLMPMLARRHRVISVDLSPPETDGRSELTLEFLVGQVSAVIETEVPGSAVGVLGYSLGAVVGTVLAATRPELVDRLILLNGWLRTDAQQTLRSLVWRTLRTENSAALGAFMTFCSFSGEFLGLLPPADVARLAAAMRTDDFVEQQMDLASRVDISDLATLVRAPTLIIASQKDQIVPPRHGRALFGAIDDARYLEITSGHAALSERVAEVLRAAESFLQNPDLHPLGSILEPLHP
jgi:pimeloyl-ACP methyl ester carboxylesterase